MNLLVFSKLVIVTAVCVPCLIEAETSIAACSPSNTNIAIDAQLPGVISTPVFPDGSRDSSCIWKIQAPANLQLKITIEVLKLSGEDDYVIIRDGGSSISPLIGKYGPCASGSLTLFPSGASVFIQLVSAVFSVDDRLRIAYRSIDPDDIDCSNGENPANYCGVNVNLRDLSGVISSPSFPNNYGAERSCLWTIIAPPGYRVQLTIHWLGIEDHRYSPSFPGSCADDSLSVSEYRGNYTNGVVKLCGCKRLFSFVSFMERMWLKFTSYKKNNWPGFYATYEVLAPEECPAGKTNCSRKNTVPVGFNAQGQVCSVLVRTSSQVTQQGTSSSLIPSSVKSLASKVSPTSSKIQVIKTTVQPTLFGSNSLPFVTSALPITGSKTSAQRTAVRETPMKGNISSSIMPHTSVLSGDKTSAGSVKHSSEVTLDTSVTSLRTSNMEPATVVSSSPSYSEQTLAPARSTFNASGASFVKNKDSNGAPPMGQLKSPSVRPTDVKGTSVAGKTTDAIEASPTIALTPNETTAAQQSALVTKQTAPLVPTSPFVRPEHISSQSTFRIPGSDSKDINPSKISEETPTGPSRTSVKQPTTQYPQVTGTDSPSKGIEVRCTHYAMEITISRILRPYLVISSLHLQDPTCEVSFSNDTHAILSAPLEGCGTQQKTSKGYFIYVNIMTGDEKSSKSTAEITRKGIMKFEFQCSYRKIHVLSIVSYSPRRKAVRTADDGVGNFTFEMDLFKDPKYDIVVNQYPVTVISGQPMYLQVNVKSRDQALLTFLEECWVTPTSDPRDQTRHTIIEQGCSRDASLDYLYKKSPLQKFTFKAFRFCDVPSKRLYVHCEVVTCGRSDTWSVCVRGCKEDRRNRRENKAAIMDKDVFLSLGPVNFEDQSGESHEPVVYVKALVGVLAAFALILLVAVVIVILRRRKIRENKNNTWILLATKEYSVQEERKM